jgi:hypothetical protein
MSYQSRTMGKASTPKKATRARSTSPVQPARGRADKLSISLPPDDVKWITRRAKRLGTSVSAVVAAAVGDQRRAEAGAELLELLGGADDVSDADLAALRREAFGP